MQDVSSTKSQVRLDSQILAQATSLIDLILLPDEGQPTCVRCRKSGFTCEGYVGTNFIHFDPSAQREDSKHSSGLDDVKGDPSNPSSSSNISWSSEVAPRDPPGIPASLSLQPFSERIYLAFAHRYLLRGSDSHFAVLHIADLGIKDRTLLTDASFSALATSFYGFKHSQRSIMREGQRRYGVALRDLNRALAAQSIAASIDILGAVVALSLFEVSVRNKSRTGCSSTTDSPPNQARWVGCSLLRSGAAV